MKKYQSFSSETLQFLEAKFSIYLNRRVFVICFPIHHYPSSERSAIKTKNLQPKGSKFVHFRPDPFSERNEGDKKVFDRGVSIESVLSPLQHFNKI